MEGYDMRIMTDYSKDTNECRKAFLALQPRLRQLEMKYGLFDPARIPDTMYALPALRWDPVDKCYPCIGQRYILSFDISHMVLSITPSL
ncbi:hypothetical protein NDU88_003844 [Pleurodeles waltl]|uniref:Uncharacterized protein n=1 Tax=Pleurodeles waltl TaxID=8319 RepID=A0AAV7L067_PLEWA|nr:hypothetical protein NDU88_003844 [Pleurodeles waltl]